MNFANRGVSNQNQSRPNQMNQATSGAAAAATTSTTKPAGKKRDWMRISTVVLLFSIAILAAGMVWLLHFANPNAGKYVSSSKLQAVFLTNGQVYFGNIKSMNDKYIDLQNIFYLSSNSSTSSSSSSSSSSELSLIKLGCELHGPYDEMVVNQEQVLFWENLKSDGQVGKAVSQWLQQNPKGQTCSQATSNTQSTSNPQSTGSSNKQ